MEFSGIEIILLIASSIILGATFIGAISVVFYLKNKSTKRKKIKRKKMTEQLYEKIINERDDKLRQEIEDALNQQISTQNTNSKSSYYKNSKHKQRDNVLYEKCENFILQLTKAGSEFIGESEENIKCFLKELHIENPDKLYSKSKNKFDYLSKKTLGFISRNKTKIDKLQKIKDIWNSNN